MAGSPPSIAPSLAVVPPMSKVSTWSKPSSRADHAAQQDAGSRPRFDDADRHIAGELGRHQPAVRLHDEEVAADALLRQGARSAGDVAVDDRLDVGVGHHGAGALVFAELGRDLRGKRNGALRACAGQALTDEPVRARPWRRHAAGTRRRTRSSAPRSRSSTRSRAAISSGCSMLPSASVRSATS